MQISIKQWLSPGDGKILPTNYPQMARLGTFSVITFGVGGNGVSLSPRIEARDTARHPTRHRADNKELSSQNVNS